MHLSWTFQLTPYSDNLHSILLPLSSIGLYYQSLVTSLCDVIQRKDTHISTLQEKLKDSGGQYFPRKYKDALEEFDQDKWRDEQRNGIRQGQGRMDIGGFERWEEVGQEEKLDWEAVVNVLGEDNEKV